MKYYEKLASEKVIIRIKKTKSIFNLTSSIQSDFLQTFLSI